MSTSQHKTLSDFVELKNRQALTHAIRAAVELGIFKALAAGQRTVEQLATEIDADPQRLKALMDVLQQSELMEQYEDDYALSTLARLIPEPFMDFGDSHWKHLVGHVKTGSSVHDLEHTPLSDLDFLINQASEEWMLTPAAMTAAQALDIGNSRTGVRILEVGCGSAVVGATLAHADPASTLTLIDTAPEIKRAKVTVDSVDIADRTTFIESDNWRDFEAIDMSGEPVNDAGTEPQLVPQPVFDLVVLTRLIHLADLEQQQQLLQKIGALLLPGGGEVAIIDLFPGQEQGESHRRVLELEFGLRHSHGQLHHPRELEQCLRKAGFPNVQFTHLPAEPYLYGLLLGEK